MVYDDPQLGLYLSEGCAISGTAAVCTVVASASDAGVQSGIETESVNSFVVQGNGALPTGVSAATTGTAGATAATSAAASAASAGSGSDSASGAAPTTTQGSGGVRNGGSAVLALVGAGIVFSLFL